MSIVVTTPTGNIGSVIVRELVEAGADVSVIVRDPARLADGVRDRVKIHQGDLFDEAFVARATEGAESLFWLNPPDYTLQDWRQQFADSARIGANAVRTNRIPNVVLLSSVGAQNPTGWGPVSFLHLIETALAETGANLLILRPGYFYENFLAQLEPIKNAGAVFMPVPPDATFPMIATRDIGKAAAKRLLAKDYAGVTYHGLHGPADQPTVAGAVAQIGEGIGKPLQYVPISMEQFRQTLSGMGASPSIVDNYAELMTALGRGEQPAEPRTPETTTPTTVREWAAEVMKPLVG